MAIVYTIGHSTREMRVFLELLQAHGVEALCDIRAFPASRRLPHFNREALAESLRAAGVEYRWMPGLGGRRKRQMPVEESPNVAMRDDSFRNYADYMLGAEFVAAIGEAIRLGEAKRTALMCAEAVYFHCHRMLVSDWLELHGHEVRHIQDVKEPRRHKVTAEARRVGEQVHYRGDRLF